MFDLTGKFALVTGASGGIGSEVAKALHAQGATVGLSGTRVEKLEKVASELGGERVHVLPANLSDPEGATQLIKDAESAMGQVDILVANAGVTRDNLTMRMKDDEWDAVISVNLVSTFKLVRAVMKGMMKRRHGRIIGIASVVGLMGNPGQANYAASKGGMIAMIKSVGAEIGARGVTCNCIAPGFIETPMTETLDPDYIATIAKSVPTGRLGKPEEIAAGVAYLASDEAAYVNGHTLNIGGGIFMS